MKKTILEEILVVEEAGRTGHEPVLGVVIGRLVGLDSQGRATVDYPGNPIGSPHLAKVAAGLGEEDVGCDIALMFEQGDPSRPIAIGPVVQVSGVREPAGDLNPGEAEEKALSASVDGERVTFTAQKEIVLQCGAASLTLTRAGKILIRGKYILSRSSGVNRIKGGSIQLN